MSMIRISYGKTVILDGSDFVSYCENHATKSDPVLAQKLMNATIDKVGNLKFFGYSINCRSTIFSDADNVEMMDLLNGMLKTRHENMIRAFFNLELVNYGMIATGRNGFLFPFLDFLKFIYWYNKSLKIPKFETRSKNLFKQVLTKAKLTLPNITTSFGQLRINNQNLTRDLLDLLDSTNNFSNELMFVSLCGLAKREISAECVHDFVVDGKAAEVKTIHDKIINLSLGYLQKTLPALFNLDNLLDEICVQTKRKKWIDDLECAEMYG